VHEDGSWELIVGGDGGWRERDLYCGNLRESALHGYDHSLVK